ncbi:sulfurtransferase TusA family protein [Ectobacillus polymachus]|uniref:sulfurtransferase TusA family protein n=1 Tax=Ectobacillus polymachus TaxID=1508806 RepID=UPI003A85D611
MVKTDVTVDAKGLSCPMPIVKTKKAIDAVQPGQVVEVQATDKGSKADIVAWAKNTGHQYIGLIEEGNVLKHYLRKASAEDQREETKYPNVITNEELVSKIEDCFILDVREHAEYAFGHIPGSYFIPFGELEEKLTELPKDKEIYVICRTGRRSDLAAQLLAKNGFTNVVNVVPGMSQWTGAIEKNA